MSSGTRPIIAVTGDVPMRHRLRSMASAAGAYVQMWHPENVDQLPNARLLIFGPDVDPADMGAGSALRRIWVTLEGVRRPADPQLSRHMYRLPRSGPALSQLLTRMMREPVLDDQGWCPYCRSQEVLLCTRYDHRWEVKHMTNQKELVVVDAEPDTELVDPTDWWAECSGCFATLQLPEGAKPRWPS